MPSKHKHPLSTRTSSPHHNDVLLCGRGGTTHDHPGNKEYRKMVDDRTCDYLRARFRRGKRLIATEIVGQIRSLNPPGRFLVKEGENSSDWLDIGDAKAREMVSQALRENALAARKGMEAELAEKKKREERDEAIAAGNDHEEAVRLDMNSWDNGKRGVRIPILAGRLIRAPSLRARRQPKEAAALDKMIPHDDLSLEHERPVAPQDDPVLAAWQGRYIELQTTPTPAHDGEEDRGLRKSKAREKYSKIHCDIGNAKDDYIIRDPRRRQSLSSYYRNLRDCPAVDDTLRERSERRLNQQYPHQTKTEPLAKSNDSAPYRGIKF